MCAPIDVTSEFDATVVCSISFEIRLDQRQAGEGLAWATLDTDPVARPTRVVSPAKMANISYEAADAAAQAAL